MAKYEQLVEQIKHQIDAGIWQAGDKLPSLRKQSEHSGLSLMTVLHAYQVLESQGWIQSRQRSGYCVSPQSAPTSSNVPRAIESMEQIDINDFIFDVLQAGRNPHMVTFGHAYPDPSLYPRHQVNKSLMAAARSMPCPARSITCRRVTIRCAQSSPNVTPPAASTSHRMKS